jgi:hypothetical protein
MASVRKRTWTSGGKAKTAWIADYFDQSGKRHQQAFPTRGPPMPFSCRRSVRSPRESTRRSRASSALSRTSWRSRAFIVQRCVERSAMCPPPEALRATRRHRDIETLDLCRWGAWRGFAGSLQLRDAVVEALTDERERCAKVAANYGREGDRLSREYACEVADEIAARIRHCFDNG